MKKAKANAKTHTHTTVAINQDKFSSGYVEKKVGKKLKEEGKKKYHVETNTRDNERKTCSDTHKHESTPPHRHTHSLTAYWQTWTQREARINGGRKEEKLGGVREGCEQNVTETNTHTHTCGSGNQGK